MVHLRENADSEQNNKKAYSKGNLPPRCATQQVAQVPKTDVKVAISKKKKKKSHIAFPVTTS